MPAYYNICIIVYYSIDSTICIDSTTRMNCHTPTHPHAHSHTLPLAQELYVGKLQPGLGRYPPRHITFQLRPIGTSDKPACGYWSVCVAASCCSFKKDSGIHPICVYGIDVKSPSGSHSLPLCC
eukprot:COSAG05_NODE_47_length_24712_cov_26.673844_13_plen_124_part_00